MGLFDRIKSLFSGENNNNPDADGFALKKATKVADLKQQFNEKFGSVLRVYSGRSQVDSNSTLGEAGLTQEGVFNCRGNLKVGTFITRMMEEYGLKVKIYTVDEWVAVLDDLTLSASGIVKKNATKADMEMMLAGPAETSMQQEKILVSEVKAGAFSVVKYSDNSYSVSIEGNICANAKGAMRQLAEAIGFEYDKGWTTQQFGAKLCKFIQENTGVKETPVNEKEVTNTEAKAAIEKATKTAAKADDKPAVKKDSKKDGELPGVFMLEDGRKICFAQGNLQFHCKNFEFRFAENQYDTIGKDNEKIAPNYDGWIDLFGWGTSGYMGCQPTETSTNESEYGPTRNLINSITGTNYDWGIFNPIKNGGDKEGIWRTPAYDEISYLLYGRPKADKLKFKCTVCGQPGVTIVPNEEFWNHRFNFPIDVTVGNYSNNSFDIKQWKQLESLGCVFFACAGYRSASAPGSSTYFDNSIRYWCSSSKSICDIFPGFNFNFRGSEWGKLYHGYAVRLIKDIK